MGLTLSFPLPELAQMKTIHCVRAYLGGDLVGTMLDKDDKPLTARTAKAEAEAQNTRSERGRREGWCGTFFDYKADSFTR